MELPVENLPRYPIRERLQHLVQQIQGCGMHHGWLTSGIREGVASGRTRGSARRLFVPPGPAPGLEPSHVIRRLGTVPRCSPELLPPNQILDLLRRRIAAHSLEQLLPGKLAVLLLAYAHRYAASVGWRAKDRAIARGEGIEDVVQDALASLYGGEPERRWDRENTPDPMDHLKSFVNSRLSSLARSYDHRNVRAPVVPEQHQDAADPESLVMTKEDEQNQNAWWEQAKSLLLEEIVNDDLLVAMHDLMEQEELNKPKELAERLSVPV